VLPEQLPCTLTLDGDVRVDVEAAEEPRQFNLRGTPGYTDIDTDSDPDDPDDEAFIPPPLSFEVETPFGPLDCELKIFNDGLVVLAMTTQFGNPTGEAFAAALEAFREVYHVWEFALPQELPQLERPTYRALLAAAAFA
jgi:hypothetical protein